MNAKRRNALIKCKFCNYQGYGFSITEHIIENHFKKRNLNDGNIYFCETQDHLNWLINNKNGVKAFMTFTFPCWVVETYTEESFNRDAYSLFTPLNITDYEDKFLNAKADLEVVKQILENK